MSNEKIILNNLLKITNWKELEKEEERISKESLLKNIENIKNLDPYDKNTFDKIHKILFKNIYPWAGEQRGYNIVKGTTKFSNYKDFHSNIQEAFEDISKLRNTEDENEKFLIIMKGYTRTNYIHKFKEGNGRTGRIWLNLILEKELNKHCNFNADKDLYMSTMVISSSKGDDSLIIEFVKDNLIDIDLNNYTSTFMKNIDASYIYEDQYYYIYDEESNSIIENRNYNEYYKKQKFHMKDD